jgi:hypothetical protein
MRYISDKARQLIAAAAGPMQNAQLFRLLSAPLFYLKDVNVLAGSVDDSELRIPANPCWIEWGDEVASPFCVSFWNTPAERIDWSMFGVASMKPFIVRPIAMGDIRNVDGGATVNITQSTLRVEADKQNIEDIEKCVSAAAYLAKVFANFHAETSEVKLSLTRKMQARRGKGRIFRHYELDLAAVSAAHSASHGGTHATPAWHIRRGHMRRLKDGRTVFVRSCEVGSKERGVVLKDYRIGATVAPPAA